MLYRQSGLWRPWRAQQPDLARSKDWQELNYVCINYRFYKHDTHNTQGQEPSAGAQKERTSQFDAAERWTGSSPQRGEETATEWGKLVSALIHLCN